MISVSFIKPGPAQVCVGPRGHGKVATTGHSGTTQALSSTAAPVDPAGDTDGSA